MSALPAPAPGRVRLSDGPLPALLVFALGLGVVLLRPPLPVDETRYLEVFRESLEGSPLLLRLAGAPYAEKPPLLFWLARVLTWLALPPEFALRIMPVLASSLTVLYAARLGARVGSSLVGWLQAALWLPSLCAQYLLFDPLLAVTVWGAIDAWVRRRDAAFTLWSAAALLAKGPVTYLFVIPFLWFTAPLRATRAGDVRRASVALVLALMPLAAWALSAAALGGPEFANALLWERWAGRVVSSVAHARPLYFYVPVVLLGALPATPLLLRRGRGPKPEWFLRAGRTLALLFVVFTLISGKQPHYLVPAAPALALLLAWRLENDAPAKNWLRRGVLIQLGLLLSLALFALVALPGLTDSFTTRGCERIADNDQYFPAVLGGASALLGLAFVLRRRLSARALLSVAVASLGTGLLPFHWLAGELLFPHDLARAIRSQAGEIAYLGSSQHGLYALLAGRELEKLRDESELAPWITLHPAGLLVVDPDALGQGTPEGFALVTGDVVHSRRVLVLCALPAGEHGARD